MDDSNWKFAKIALGKCWSLKSKQSLLKQADICKCLQSLRKQVKRRIVDIHFNQWALRIQNEWRKVELVFTFIFLTLFILLRDIFVLSILITYFYSTYFNSRARFFLELVWWTKFLRLIIRCQPAGPSNQQLHYPLVNNSLNHHQDSKIQAKATKAVR